MFKSSVALALTLAACSGEVESTQDTMPRLDEPAECVEEFFEDITTEEIAAAKDRLAAALMVADSVADDEVQEVASFIRAKTTIDVLAQDLVEVIVLNDRKQEDCDFFSFVQSSPAFGNYNDDAKAVILIDKTAEPVSETWGGLLTLHELRHAYSRNKQLEVGVDDEYEELETRLFEQRVMRKIGGEKYQEYLQQLKGKVVTEGFNETSQFSIPDIRLLSAEFETFNDLFGPAISERDARIRNSALYTHAIFELIDETAETQGFTPQEAKQSYLQQIGALG